MCKLRMNVTVLQSSTATTQYPAVKRGKKLWTQDFTRDHLERFVRRSTLPESVIHANIVDRVVQISNSEISAARQSQTFDAGAASVPGSSYLQFATNYSRSLCFHTVHIQVGEAGSKAWLKFNQTDRSENRDKSRPTSPEVFLLLATSCLCS